MAQLGQQRERRKALCNVMLDDSNVLTMAAATEIIVAADDKTDFEGVETINPSRAAS
ncbi:hypothetical protein [Bradyrhizobium zhanjiangense]|uniref:hypothetical protein n=1 Tax=Bradyrhizobium zhanjiangense TaxID=1325107 RepID=UPI0013E8E8B2|nr:hypothetical protein [Bradyrhizobium zhanjiangense]